MIRCKILNNDTVAEGIGIKPERIWASFAFDEDEVYAWSEWMEDNEVQHECTEVFFKIGKQFIIDIPFIRFDSEMSRNRKIIRICE